MGINAMKLRKWLSLQIKHDKLFFDNTLNKLFSYLRVGVSHAEALSIPCATYVQMMR
jgi:hypothetical protein